MEKSTLTIDLYHNQAIKLFDDLDTDDLSIEDKNLIRSAFNFHLYFAKRLKDPDLKLQDIRKTYGLNS